MVKKKNILLTHGSLHVPADQMMSIDIEGAPTLVKQVSIYDFNHELLYNKTAPAGKELSQGEITKIQRILNRARVLVGHSLDSDLMALRRRGVYLYNDTRCLDTYFTLLEMKAEGLLDNRYNGATLKETALYFHIRANDYHTSHTDALATAVVAQEMMKQGDGMMVEITPSIIQIPRPPFGMEPDWEKEERGDMQQNKSVGPKADSRVYQNGDFYECVIAGGQGPTFVRMTREEYDLFLRIRELRPDYTVRLYNETILTPSIVARLAALEEAEKAAEAAPVAMAPEIEEVEVPAEEEEPVSLETEEAPAVEVPAKEIEEEESESVDASEEIPAAEGDVNEVPLEMESAEEDPLEFAAPEDVADEGQPAEAESAETVADAEMPSEEANADAESPREVEEAAPEEVDVEASSERAGEENLVEVAPGEADAPVEEILTETELAEIPREESEIAVDVDYRYHPTTGSDDPIYLEEESKAEEAGDGNLISFMTEEAVELPPLPEESGEIREGASEPLFGEGIWDLPEDFPVVKAAELPAEEEKHTPPLKLEEEDAFSMSLFFEPEESK